MGHLAYTLADSIYRMQRDELDISRSDVKCAEVAGACFNKDTSHTPMFPLTALHCKRGRGVRSKPLKAFWQMLQHTRHACEACIYAVQIGSCAGEL